MRGKIIKGIAGFYYVHDGISQVYECKAKGVFRSRKIKPLVGDDVEFTVLDEKEQTGNITDILERKNELIRPAVANIDQAMIVFAVTDPEPNLNLLDRFLVTMEMQGVPAVICFNKMDLGTGERERELRQIYEPPVTQSILPAPTTKRAWTWSGSSLRERPQPWRDRREWGNPP